MSLYRCHRDAGTPVQPESLSDREERRPLLTGDRYAAWMSSLLFCSDIATLLTAA